MHLRNKLNLWQKITKCLCEFLWFLDKYLIFLKTT